MTNMYSGVGISFWAEMGPACLLLLRIWQRMKVIAGAMNLKGCHVPRINKCYCLRRFMEFFPTDSPLLERDQSSGMFVTTGLKGRLAVKVQPG